MEECSDVKKDPAQYQINREFKFQPSFQANSSFISKALFLWTHQLIKIGNSKHLQMEDLSDLTPDAQPQFCYSQFQNIYQTIHDNNDPQRLFSTFKKYIGPTIILGGLLTTFANLLQFSGPIIIGKLLAFLNREDSKDNMMEGIFYVTIMVVCFLARTIILQHGMRFVNMNCQQVLNSSNTLMYKKILKLSSSARKYLEVGAIMNHINVDVNAVVFFIVMNGFLFSAPAMIFVAIIMLIIEVGWIGFVAPLLFAIGMIFQQKLLTKGLQIRKNRLYWSDKRSKCVNQYFSGIRIIKYYGWQQMVADNIENIRKQQLRLNFKALMIQSYIEVLMNMLPILSSIIIFAVFVAAYGQQQLTTAKVYTVLAIFNLIAVPMRLIAVTLVNYLNARASLERLEHFLGYQQNVYKQNQNKDMQQQIGQVTLSQCKFVWQIQATKKHYLLGKKLYKNFKQQKSEQKISKKKKVKKNKKLSSEEKTLRKKSKKKKKKSVLTQSDSLTRKLLDNVTEQSLTQQTKKYDLIIDNLKINRGQFVSIVGRVGSGKSTLLSAILGQIHKLNGSVKQTGKISYISQISWLRSATIRENILFQSPYDQKRYEYILKICELQQDLKILSGGDLTQIGQKGVNLSGGQKQRISIARAVYNDADLYLIDDCLSALDAFVAKNIFNNVLLKFLHQQGKTIVFVTNAIDYAEQTERIIVLHNGKIVQDGAPQKIKQQRDSLFNKLKIQYKKSKEEQKQEQQTKYKKKCSEDSIQDIGQENQIAQKKKQQKKKQIQGLVKVQQRLKGSVPWSFYVRFFTGPGNAATFLIFFIILFAQFSRVASDWWLGQWGRKGFDISQTEYIWIFSLISIVVGSLLYIKGIFFAKFILSTSRVIQKKLISTLLKTPLGWFDATPTGRILARTTKDQDDLDNNLSFNVQNSIQNLFVLVASIFLISVATPLYLTVAVISGIFYYKIISMYMNSSRQIKRLQSNTRAPLLSHFQETISGIYVIRAFKKQQNFIKKFLMRQKNLMVSMSNQYITVRWISLMTDLFSILTIAAAGYLGVVSVAAKIGPSATNFIGLALVWSLQINSILSFTLRVMADTQSNMNAVVRLYDYIDNNPSEKDYDHPKPQVNPWPNHGVFNIKQISYKYRDDLPYVIKNISFDMKQNAKIGIVGRTGSGKSTITLGLLRILQIVQNQNGTIGQINLDNQNISKIGLHHLRHNVAIIPQDPVLFTGTIKLNIDPLDRYNDQDIATCLKKVELWNQIKNNQLESDQVRKKIYSNVDESGSNFSLGQRQLICMARALIRKPKVLLMDQATASIDQKTDQTIQAMIRNEFINTTVITIAHRLNTIIHYNKILVLNNGNIQEYDTPINLLKNQKSFLGSMVRKVGKGYLQKMLSLSQKTYKFNE